VAVAWLASGTAVISRTETALFTGTATISDFPTVKITGTGTIDRTSVAAWGAQIRRTATRVLLGEEAEDLARISGTVGVTLDEHGLVETASFTVTDPRCAFFDPLSITVSGLPVSIRCRIATDLAETDDTVFRGVTEAAPSSGAYVPTATIQCVGEGSDWLTPQACLSVAAFSGYTRLDILKAYAASVGITADRIVGGETWREVRQGLDLSGLSPYELAKRFAEMEDCYVTLRGDVLHILPAAEVVGPAAAAVYDFTQSNLFSASETPPNRPVARLVLSSVGIPEEILTGGTEETTAALHIETAPDLTRIETRTYTTTVNGVLVSRRIEEWRDAAIPGVTPSAVAFRLWKLVETTTTWGTVTIDGVSLRTSRMDSERTVTTEWYSAPCRTSSGYVWAAPDGKRHIAASATWQVTGDQITTYTYDADCVLVSKITNAGGWYSEKVASGHAYDDGTQRADISYQWIAPTDAQPYTRQTENSTEERSATLAAVTAVQRDYGWDGADVETWGQITGRDDRWEGTPGSGTVWHASTEYLADGSRVEDAALETGSVPQLARASADIPQYRTEPIVLEATAGTSDEVVTETVWGAEDHADLASVARQRFRSARSPRYQASTRANPHLRQYDVVTVTDPTWQHDERVGYVAGYSLTLDASTTGALDADYVVVFPLPAYDPEVTA
jgi:hypothetical protein